MKSNLLTILVISFNLNAVSASQQSAPVLSDLYIKSQGAGQSGLVEVSGKKDKKGNFISLTINAFGKTIKCPEDILKKISRDDHSGIQLTFKSTHKKHAGEKIYIQLQAGSAISDNELIVIVVSEDGKVTID